MRENLQWIKWKESKMSYLIRKGEWKCPRTAQGHFMLQLKEGKSKAGMKSISIRFHLVSRIIESYWNIGVKKDTKLKYWMGRTDMESYIYLGKHHPESSRLNSHFSNSKLRQ